MTITAPVAIQQERIASPLTVLMCRPEHFTVSYSINPWMHPEDPTDTSRALSQWHELRRVFERLQFTVRLVEPGRGLPDMVFAANGGLVVDGTAYTARFTFPERAPEADLYADWFRAAGYDVVAAEETNEGEGDVLLAGDALLAGTGFRTDTASHAEMAALYGREVVSLRLVRPDFYHLDTALAVLDARPGHEHIAYLPSAFDDASRAELERRFPDAILVDEHDAKVFGLNAVSDGLHVITAARATAFQHQLREAGYEPIGVDLTELLLAGGGAKCCTLVLRDRPTTAEEAR
ncbi:dimethylargininase [Demequina capsici]